MTTETFSVDDNKFFKYGLMISGLLISSIGINAFLTPANILSSGLTGICVMLYNLFGFNQGVASFLMNIPIFIIARKFFDKKFLFLNFINMFIYSAALGLTQDLSRLITVNDTMLLCIYGGLLNGIGMGMVFKAQCGAGGLDMISAILKRKFDIPLKNTILGVNVIVVGVGGLIYGPKLVMYTLIAIYVTAIAMDITKNAFDIKKSIIVISDRNEEIAKEIMTTMKSGVTFLDAEGAYTNNKKKLIYCIVPSNKLLKLKEIVYSIDKNAFISVNQVEEVRGAGFKERFL